MVPNEVHLFFLVLGPRGPASICSVGTGGARDRPVTVPGGIIVGRAVRGAWLVVEKLLIVPVSCSVDVVMMVVVISVLAIVVLVVVLTRARRKVR